MLDTKKEVRKVLWTRKAPACLRTVLYEYDKPRLCMNIHYYVPQLTVSGRLQCMLRCTHCASSMLHRIETDQLDNYSLIILYIFYKSEVR